MKCPLRYSPLISCSVVLVHGLFGHPRKTWTGRITRSRTTRFSSSRATSPSHTSTILEDTLSTNGGETAHTAHGNNEQVETDPDSVFWPQALLPSVIPDARIFTWGYDADIDGFLSTASQNTVHQHAINLLSDLADLRRSVEDVSGQLGLPGGVDFQHYNLHLQNQRVCSPSGLSMSLYQMSPPTPHPKHLGSPARGSRPLPIQYTDSISCARFTIRFTHVFYFEALSIHQLGWIPFSCLRS